MTEHTPEAGPTRQEKALLKIREGISARNVLFDLFRYVTPDKKKREDYIDSLLEEEKRRQGIRNIILGIPWNKLGNKLSNIVQKDKTEHTQDNK